jgi:hypothetical protein
MDVEVAASEARLSVGEVKVPGAAEGLVKPQCSYLNLVILETLTPQPQCLCVMSAERVSLAHPQSGVPTANLGYGPDGWDQAAGKYLCVQV